MVVADQPGQQCGDLGFVVGCGISDMYSPIKASRVAAEVYFTKIIIFPLCFEIVPNPTRQRIGYHPIQCNRSGLLFSEIRIANAFFPGSFYRVYLCFR